MRPTYAYELLMVNIQFATINEIREIAALVRKEKDMYGLQAYNALIVSISKRLIMLSQSLYSANHSRYTKSFESDRIQSGDKQALSYTSAAHR